MSESSKGHLPSVDRLKGVAIVWVICIHAKIGEGTLVYQHLVNRAVPIFLVLFGVTSELWWARREAEERPRIVVDWWRSRLQRLLVPLWGAMALWWIAVLVTGSAPERVGLGDALASFAGYAPFIGTTWFITLALQLVILFPALRAFAARTPEWITLPATAALCAASTWYVYDVIEWGREWLGGADEPGWYYAWIFSPRTFWNVVLGIVVARRFGGVPSRAVTIGAALVALLGVPGVLLARGDPESFIAPQREQIALYLFDAPLALALLGIAARLRLPESLARPLEWCGRASWGLYLGHLLVHELLHLSGIALERGPRPVQSMYALALLAAAVALTASGSTLRRLTRNAGTLGTQRAH